MSLLQQLICDSFSRTTPAQAVDLDGTNDYFSRASDLTGNADGKTFTFSAWVWPNAYSEYIYCISDSGKLIINVGSSTISIVARNVAGADILSATCTTPANSTWSNILISIDLANAANRSVYINDVVQSMTWTTYTNDNIDFTNTPHYINGVASAATQKCRLAHVYLDKTYRDLSNVTNRRLFITADRKPVSKASLAALNPILYLPMDDPSTAHINSGTGGNFTLNGTIARSGRGPNQYNVAYSTLNGSTQYLSRTTAPTGIADSTAFTLHFNINTANLASDQSVFAISTGVAMRFQVLIGSAGSAGQISIIGRNASATVVLNVTTSVGALSANRNYSIQVSVDLTNSANRQFFINGQVVSATWTTYTNSAIDFAVTTTPNYLIGAESTTPTVLINGKLGDVWFNTSYIDLSVASNLAKFVTGTGIDAKPVDLGANGELPTGTSPLIYLPMYGNNAGKNYGTGGDFTVNAGPYPGARGPNEFWGNKADFGNSASNYLARTAGLTGLTTSSSWFISFWVNIVSDATDSFIFSIGAGTFYINIDSNNFINGITASGTSFSCTGTAVTTGVWNHIIVERTGAASYNVYLNGVSLTVSSSGSNSSFSDNSYAIFGTRWTGSMYTGKMNGAISEFYFANQSLDATLEATRLKFRDAFGNPTDLPAAIQAGTVPNPAVYMRFDPANQGKNSGAGGDFTKSGTITDGGQL